MVSTAALYRRHRYPAEIISHAVWLYFRLTLSYRDIEVLLAERDVQVSHETIGQCGVAGPAPLSSALAGPRLGTILAGTSRAAHGGPACEPVALYPWCQASFSAASVVLWATAPLDPATADVYPVGQHSPAVTPNEMHRYAVLANRLERKRSVHAHPIWPISRHTVHAAGK